MRRILCKNLLFNPIILLFTESETLNCNFKSDMCNWKVAERGVKWNRHTSEIDGIYIKDLSLYLHLLNKFT